VAVSCPPALRSLYHDGRLLPFIGAGVSAAVEWTRDDAIRRGPTWAELVEEATRRLGFESPNLARARGTDLQILEYFRLKQHGFADLTNWLYTEMQPPDDALAASPIHTELARLTKCRFFYTTNYDDFLERAFELSSRQCRKIAIEAHMGDVSHEPETQIVKFHGDLSHPEEMVLSEADYLKRLRLDSAMDFRLRGDMLGRAILFLGYSFNDWNVAYLFRTVNDVFGNLPESVSGRRAYIAISEPSDFETRLFDARNIEVIPVRRLERVEDIAALLRQIREEP
jgi:hypothetical protein